MIIMTGHDALIAIILGLGLLVLLWACVLVATFLHSDQED